MNPLNTPIQIGGHIIKTEYEPNLLHPEKCTGLFVPRDDKILILPDCPDIIKTEAWFHELNEAINIIFCADKMCHDHIEEHAQAMLQIAPQLGLQIEWPK